MLLIAFLEISRYLFLPSLAKLSTRSEFLQLLFSNVSQCCENNQNRKYLSRISERVWLPLIENCSSFQARDCNACFSQIFEEKTFGNLNFEEASLFATQREYDSYCQTCEKDVSFNSRIFLTYVTHSGLKKFGYDLCSWLLYVANVHTQPGKLICKDCKSPTNELKMKSTVSPKFVFVEFAPEIMESAIHSDGCTSMILIKM